MRSLGNYITETFNQSVNEAFESRMLSKLMQNKDNQKLFGRGTQFIALAWDKIKDEDIEVHEPKRGRAIARKDEKAIVLWIDASGTVLGISNGNWVQVTGNGRGYGSGQPEYKSTLAMMRAAEETYVLRGPVVKPLNKERVDKRNQRWAQKTDVVAWQDNNRIKDDNLERYKNIITKRKNDAVSEDVDNAVKKVMDYYGEVFKDLVGSPDWLKIRKVGEQVEALTKAYSEVAYIRKNLANGDAYQHQMRKVLELNSAIMAKLEKIERENTAQTDA